MKIVNNCSQKCYKSVTEMTGEIKLETSLSQKRKGGFPLKCFLHDKDRLVFVFKNIYFEKDQWNFDKNLPKTNKKDILFVKTKRNLLENLLFEHAIGKKKTLKQVKNQLLGIEKKIIDESDISFYDFSQQEIDKLRSLGKDGTADIYLTSINQLKALKPTLLLSDIESHIFEDFKTIRLMKGNKKNTIHKYISVFKALYNKACRHYKIQNEVNPFQDVFKGITVKKNRTKKKNVSKETIKLLESITGLSSGQERALDIWLLEFYLGGQDLYDIYYLKKEFISNGRAYFQRGKLDDDGYQFDLKIFDKAQKIIDKYLDTKTVYVFPWRKNQAGYKTFRRNMQRDLQKIQNNWNAIAEDKEKETGLSQQKITIEPLGGILANKVARHSFATIGKRLFIPEKLIMELQGHEIEGINSVYSDTYTENVRDEYHQKIIY